MKAMAFNGSPRKNWNTATLLERALLGAASQGAETELIHLYEVDFKGCISCFECKKKGGKSLGKCAATDELLPILRQIEQADVLILGCPVYLGLQTGEMRCFLERLFFQYLKYDKERSSAFEGKIQGGFIYTMNAAEDRFSGSLSEQNAQSTERMFKRILHGDCESLFVFDTMQFTDYSIYETSSHDPVAKLKRREEVFPIDCQKAFDLGARLVQKAGEQG